MRKYFVLIPVLFIVGCAATQNSEYAQVVDRKYNTVRYVSKDAGGTNAFIGTSATQSRNTPPRQHP